MLVWLDFVAEIEMESFLHLFGPKCFRSLSPRCVSFENIERKELQKVNKLVSSSKFNKTLTGLLKPTFQEGTVSFVFGGPFETEGDSHF